MCKSWFRQIAARKHFVAKSILKYPLRSTYGSSSIRTGRKTYPVFSERCSICIDIVTSLSTVLMHINTDAQFYTLISTILEKTERRCKVHVHFDAYEFGYASRRKRIAEYRCCEMCGAFLIYCRPSRFGTAKLAWGWQRVCSYPDRSAHTSVERAVCVHVSLFLHPAIFFAIWAATESVAMRCGL